LAAAAYGASGAITGLANIAPRVCAKAFELAKAGKAAEALELAQEISTAEWAFGRGNILGTKVSRVCDTSSLTADADDQYATAKYNSYPSSAAKCRKPLPAVPETTKKHVESECAGIIALERQLEKEGWTGAALRDGAATSSKKQNGHVNGNGNGVFEKIKESVAAL
jgi:4-hydroxy-2-oxoglutarate aldolase